MGKLTRKSTWESDRLYFTSRPMPLSTHDLEPCMNVIETDVGMSHIRFSIGRLAQPNG
jgi:hypothetical protein